MPSLVIDLVTASLLIDLVPFGGKSLILRFHCLLCLAGSSLFPLLFLALWVFFSLGILGDFKGFSPYH